MTTTKAVPGTCISPLAKRPILYTDTIKGEQVCRDDMWAVTTDELNALALQSTACERRVEEAVSTLKSVTDNIRKDYPIKSADYFEPGTQEKALSEKYDKAWDEALETVDEYFEEALESLSQPKENNE